MHHVDPTQRAVLDPLLGLWAMRPLTLLLSSTQLAQSQSSTMMHVIVSNTAGSAKSWAGAGCGEAGRPRHATALILWPTVRPCDS